MIGKYQLQLGSDQFISGMASSDYATDGGLGTSSQNLNPFIKPGTIYSLAAGTDISTNVSGNIIASCEDSSSLSPLDRYMVDDASSAANYYSYNGTAITKVKTGTATYIQGKSDMVAFNGNFYISGASTLTQWDGTSGAGLNESYKTFVDSSAWHPLLNFINYLYFGDGNLLQQMDTSGTVVTIWTLPPKEKIVALGIDPSTGLLLISVSSVYDVSDTLSSLKAVYLHDGISATYRRKIIVDDLVTAFYQLEGRVYIGAGQTIGVWNGTGVTFLRKLQYASLSNVDLPYKHHFANIRNILLVVDGYQVLAYGAVISGSGNPYGNTKAFFYMGQPLSGINHLTAIIPFGTNKFGISYATNKVISFDISSLSGGTGLLYFNSTYFPRPIYIRRIRIVTSNITTNTGIGGVALYTENNFRQPPGLLGQFSVLSANSPKNVFDFDFTDIKAMMVQPRISFDSAQGFAIYRVYLYYDIAE